MNLHKKILSMEGVRKLEGSDFSLCYGHFNLVHPGHLRYLHHAKKINKKLIVAIRSDKDLDGDMFAQHYTEVERSTSIANIHIVDNVVILNKLSIRGLIDLLRPSGLVLGKEFELEKTEQISFAIEEVKKYNGFVDFHAGDTHYSSSDLLYDSALNIEEVKKNSFRKICNSHNITYDDLHCKIQNFSNVNLLVIGDTIVDNYVACEAIGMSAEAPVLVVQELENREFIGGAAIVASHVKSLGGQCTYMSVIGDDPQANNVEKVLKDRGINVNLFVDKSRPTTYKTRYMVDNQKLFRVSKIKSHQISSEIEKDIIQKLTNLAPKLDGIMVSDFVYGVITLNVLDKIRSLAKKFNIKLFGDLQCSSQVGSVLKFQEFDLITPTEKESRIALGDNEGGIEWISNTLLKKTKSKNMLIKLGPEGFIAYGNQNPIQRQNFPALTVNPVDLAGAGDSLFAAMSISLSSGSSLVEASLIGSCMASLAVKEVGNIPISKDKLSEYIKIILK